MTQNTHSRPRVKSTRPKPSRTCRLSAGEGGSRRILTLYVGKEAFLYWLAPIQADWGRGFELEKFAGGETYHVHLDDVNGHSCSCMGFLRWGHCKHVDSLLALDKAGRLS
jgi:hypothetical protein